MANLSLSSQKKVPVSALGAVYYGTNSFELQVCLDSIARGSVLPDEVIIVLDGAVSSALIAVIENISHCLNIKIISLADNSGFGTALREGLNFCKNPYILRFDTDDINHPLRLEYLYGHLISHPEVDILGSYVLEYSLCHTQFIDAVPRYAPLRDSMIKFFLGFGNPLNHPSVIFKKCSILSVGSYQSMPFFEDYYLWLRAKASSLVFENIPKFLVLMRRQTPIHRRSGLSYALYEITFFRLSLFTNLLSVFSLPIFFARFILRIYPLPRIYFSSFIQWFSKKTIRLPNPDVVLSSSLANQMFWPE